jgi:LPXTG-motif cell wall-anchored protein
MAGASYNFLIFANGNPLPMRGRQYFLGDSVCQTDNSSGEFTLRDGEQAIFFMLPDGEYRVVELCDQLRLTGDEPYEMTVLNKNDHLIYPDNLTGRATAEQTAVFYIEMAAELIFKNEFNYISREGELEVTKRVTIDGEAPSSPPEGFGDAVFSFTLESKTEPDVWTAVGGAAFEIDGVTDFTSDAGVFELKHGESALFSLPAEIDYRVTEEPPADFGDYSFVSASGFAADDNIHIAADEVSVVLFTNDYTHSGGTIVPTPTPTPIIVPTPTKTPPVLPPPPTSTPTPTHTPTPTPTSTPRPTPTPTPVLPPEESGTPGLPPTATATPAPPVIASPQPSTPGGTLIPGDDDDIYIEIDDGGTPIGEWHRDPDGAWKYEPIPPISEMPKTGDSTRSAVWVALGVTAGVCIVALVVVKRRQKF